MAHRTNDVITREREAVPWERTAPTIQPEQRPALPNGPAAAAILAAGVGSLALGLITTVDEAIEGLAQHLTLNDGVGDLSGKSLVAVVAWLGSWLVFHFLWRDRRVDFGRVFGLTLVLTGLGTLGTFPPFFEFVADAGFLRL